ncbi:hypothetical protein L1987_15674 [Smallanthus sonchifolius]|uniref:Uncharacterized protein n=1 Tax=Smallanthus sonchifolius TaxID=185202 RepID=A0ACB9J8W4_9ASTR|nr:hypothetical protein L1987_15674 [Smallanthus sonchifolius]
MPHTLNGWLEEEDLPSIHEIGESSQAPRPLPLTGEPVERTVPTPVAQDAHRDLETHSVRDDIERLKGLHIEIYTIQEQSTMRGAVHLSPSSTANLILSMALRGQLEWFDG